MSSQVTEMSSLELSINRNDTTGMPSLELSNDKFDVIRMSSLNLSRNKNDTTGMPSLELANDDFEDKGFPSPQFIKMSLCEEAEKAIQNSFHPFETGHHLRCELCSETFICKDTLSEHIIAKHQKKSPQSTQSPSKILIEIKSSKRTSAIKTKKKQFSCEICHKDFKRKDHLITHKDAVHENKRPFSCDICNVRFKQKHHLTSHFIAKHNNNNSKNILKRFHCAHCDKTFYRKYRLSHHISRDHEIIVCSDNSEKPFETGANHMSHNNSVHGNVRLFSCATCDKTFQRKEQLSKHISCDHETVESNNILTEHINAMHQKKSPQSTQSPSKILIEIKSSKRTSAIKTKKKQFSCEICHKDFKRKDHLITHKDAVHENKRPFSCDICNVRFKQKHHLTSHFIAKHNNNNSKNILKRFHCAHCDKTFYRKYRLSHHISRDHENIACSDNSEKPLETGANHVSHNNSVHGNVRLFSCATCDKTFQRKDNLLKHISCVHKNNRPFSCPSCGNTFKTKEHLSQHMKNVHEKTWSFGCATCDKKFQTRSGLLRHIKMVHDKIRPFSCATCHRTFTQKQSLRHHVCLLIAV